MRLNLCKQRYVIDSLGAIVEQAHDSRMISRSDSKSHDKNGDDTLNVDKTP